MKAMDTSIEAVAELLPPERRERFFALISRFENVPEDDEHLRILEAMGFLTLIMKAIPNEIAETWCALRHRRRDAIRSVCRSRHWPRQTQSALAELPHTHCLSCR